MDDTIVYSIDADTSGFETAIGELEKQAGSLGDTLTGAFKSAVLSGKSLEDVLRNLSLKLVGSALDAGLQPLQNILNNVGSSLFSGFGGVTPFAAGGVVGSGGGVLAAPTYFPMQSGFGLAGEAGAEAIMPLARGADGRLGVAAQAGGSSRPVNITVNIQTQDVDSFRRSGSQVSAALTRAVVRGQRGN